MSPVLPDQIDLHRVEELASFGLIIVDHGSRRAESNKMLLRVVEMFKQATAYPIVEPAHMEIAAPSISDAMDRCVEQGAASIVIFPYFLLPGRHWDRDIPALAADAAARHNGLKFLVTAPLGLHPLMMGIINDRIRYCVERARDQDDECDVCRGTGKCQWQG